MKKKLDAKTEGDHVEQIRKMRAAQKRYFTTRGAGALDAMRAAEETVIRDVFGGRLDGAIPSVSPAGLEVLSMAASMLTYQQAWAQTRGSLLRAPSGTPEAAKLQAEEIRLRGTCEAKERRLDRAIDHYLNPPLPGL